MPIQIARSAPIVGRFAAPASKPETQRALVLAALADGESAIANPLICRETQAMMEACRALGAGVDCTEREMRVAGIGPEMRPARGPESMRYVWAAGSALVGRVFAAIGSACPDRVVVDGNSNLRSRPFAPLFEALAAKGVDFAFFDREGSLPCAALCRRLPGGRFRLATSVSSQFATALMVPAPLAKAPTTIELTGPLYSLSYINQTADFMRRFGVDVRISEDRREIRVSNAGGYAARRASIPGDYTSASYLLGAAFVSRGDIVVSNLDPANLQGERAIVDIVEALGGTIEWSPEGDTLAVDCSALPEEVDADFDLRECPNIMPTVAAMAATIPGRVRLTGVRLTQNHKSPRIEAMATELKKAGIRVGLLRDEDGTPDGLEVRGQAMNRGGTSFSSHGDHRIFMSLVLFALSCERPCVFSEAEDSGDSFPGFLELLGLAGAHEGYREYPDDDRQLVQSAG